ncbi:SDR family NAD(P)-dependent oxidoreductase [uncultured Jatrophihabitans sp.]|uniref:SDR family NAD(P)-dependent oxidoreductase n=1 Tax=uncultured Jatrophihabitans sp. TaxID=1610747 RepID=UPI0035C98F44
MADARPVERPLHERVVVVTGAAKGLGDAIARELAPRCAALLLADLDAERVEAQADRLRAEGRKATAWVADLTDPGSAGALIDVADAEFGGADVLVNNAGIVEYAPLAETSRELFRRLMAVDVESVYFLTQAFADSLRRRESGGCVVNLGTSHALTGVGGTSAYSTAKGAVHAMTRALAVELAPLGIRVNTLALGTTLTERVRSELAPELLRKRMRQIPLARGARPQEAAAAVAYLLDAGFATGTELVLDGGFTVFGDA